MIYFSRVVVAHIPVFMSVRQGSARLTAVEDEYKMVPFQENFEVSCSTMAVLLNQFDVNDDLADELSIDTEECAFWQNVMYDYCGFCEEPPPRDDACEFPCEFENVVVPETFVEESFQCVFNYFDSLVLTEEDRETCNSILADSRSCCKRDDDVSHNKGSMKSMKKKKTGMSMKSGQVRSKSMTRKKEKGKTEKESKKSKSKKKAKK